MAGPLEGLRIIELAAIGPAPFCGMMLADHGAEVIRIDRPGGSNLGFGIDQSKEVLSRSRRTIIVDIKTEAGADIVRDLATTADGFIEGFRPGVTEGLGLGPGDLMLRNPRLVYGRMTGWGQFGPYARAAGHDINYIALAGALHGMGRAGEKPTPPINLVGDFGGGGLLLAFGMLAAILHARSSGRGQVIDCAMTDGSALLMSLMWGLKAMGAWKDERGVNMIDSGAHFYNTYATADGKYISIGAIEPHFYAKLLERVGLKEDSDFNEQMDARRWKDLERKLDAIFRTKTRDEWCLLLAETDACYAPVLSLDEASLHPHNVARQTFLEVGGVVQPAPAPRFDGTPSGTPTMTAVPGADTSTILTGLGYSTDRIERLRNEGIVS